MPAPTVGLQTHIWNNNLKSMIFLGLYPLIILGMVWCCAYAVGYMQYGAGELAQYPIKATGARQVLGRSFGQINTVSATGFASNILYAYWPSILAVIATWFVVAFFFHSNMIGAMAKSHSVSRQNEPALYNMLENLCIACLLYTSPSPRDQRGSRMPSSA